MTEKERTEERVKVGMMGRTRQTWSSNLLSLCLCFSSISLSGDVHPYRETSMSPVYLDELTETWNHGHGSSLVCETMLVEVQEVFDDSVESLCIQSELRFYICHGLSQSRS